MDAQVGKPASAPVGSGAHSTVKRCARPSAVVRTAQCSFGIHTLVSLRMFPRSDALQTLRKEIKEEKKFNTLSRVESNDFWKFGEHFLWQQSGEGNVWV